jgi:1,2-dihydroxy-3-keto-5-methylthiopentene dioxygenase
MAHIHVPETDRHLEDPREIADFLKPLGIIYECWDIGGHLGERATDEQILEAYRPEIERLKAAGGYVTADVINVTPQTPGLQQMLDRFNKEHRHTEDEVRFIVRGRGIFHINPVDQPVFALQVGPGDLINVPAGTRH